MADVLVIGGNGFIGSHLVDTLSAAGHRVSVFDMFPNGRPRWRAEGVEMINGNFLNEGDLSNAVSGRDVVVHLLSTTDPASAELDPTLDIRTNILGSVSLFEMCVDAGVQRVYFASSGGAIYGDQRATFFNEESRTLPVSPYAIGKLTIENYLRFFSKKFGLESTTFRISNPFGTRQNPHKRQGIIPIFLNHILRGEPITVMGDGSMVRDYIYVKDLAMILSTVISRGASEGVYNVGSGVATSVMDIVDAIESATGERPEIHWTPVPATYVDHVSLDTSRLTQEFGRFELTPLREGIARTWEEIREQGV